MGDEKKPFKVTPGRAVILKALDGQDLKWGPLRKAYFGEERAKSKSSTAFYTQTTKLQALGIISKVNEVYSLTDAGKEVLAKVKESNPELLENAKSVAQANFIAPPVVEEAAAPEAEAEAPTEAAA